MRRGGGAESPLAVIVDVRPVQRSCNRSRCPLFFSSASPLWRCHLVGGMGGNEGRGEGRRGVVALEVGVMLLEVFMPPVPGAAEICLLGGSGVATATAGLSAAGLAATAAAAIATIVAATAALVVATADLADLAAAASATTANADTAAVAAVVAVAAAGACPNSRCVMFE